MTTNDTKALVAELREIRATMSENTNLLRLLAKQVEKAEARAKETDGSTPENPREDGTYGWPKTTRQTIDPIFDADLNLIERPKS